MKLYELFVPVQDFSPSLIDFLKKSKLDIGAININGYLINYFNEFDNINLNISYPHSDESLAGYCILLKHYLERLKHKAKSINIGIPNELIKSNNRNAIKNYLETIHSIVQDYELNSRVILEYSHGLAKLEEINDIIEQSKVGTIILNNPNSQLQSDNLNDFLIHCFELAKQISIPIGVMVSIKDIENIKKLKHTMFNPVLLLPETMVKLH